VFNNASLGSRLIPVQHQNRRFIKTSRRGAQLTVIEVSPNTLPQ